MSVTAWSRRLSPAVVSFSVASGVRPLGDGTFMAELSPVWTIGGRPHGGYLLAVLTRAALASVDPRGQNGGLDPVAVSAEFLSSPEVGPAMVRTEVRKTGRTLSVVRSTLEQRGRVCVEASVTLGRLSAEPEVVWADLPQLPASPTPRSVDLGALPLAEAFRVTKGCELRLDTSTAVFLSGATGDDEQNRAAGDPVLRMWTRPKGERTDLLFALVAGDITPPVTFNLGRIGWSPTVQLTALLRARPAPGWLRVEARCRAVHGQWFDEDLVVVDSAGRLVCQARQLALAPADPAREQPREQR